MYFLLIELLEKIMSICSAKAQSSQNFFILRRERI